MRGDSEVLKITHNTYHSISKCKSGRNKQTDTTGQIFSFKLFECPAVKACAKLKPLTRESFLSGMTICGVKDVLALSSAGVRTNALHAPPIQHGDPKTKAANAAEAGRD